MVDQAAATAGHGLSVAYDRKMTKAAEACRSDGMDFILMPTEAGTSRLCCNGRSWPLPWPGTQKEIRARPPDISLSLLGTHWKLVNPL